jgi:hypothetical protein
MGEAKRKKSVPVAQSPEQEAMPTIDLTDSSDFVPIPAVVQQIKDTLTHHEKAQRPIYLWLTTKLKDI